ncbi:hypothetical protein NSQ26_14075 [Bacillus sp. FSL W7-1360]
MVMKSFLASLSVLVMFMLVAPSFASASTDGVPNMELKRDFDDLGKYDDDIIEEQGWKLWTIKQALRHGGDILSKIIKPLSKKNANLVKKYSKKMADGLDKFSTKSEKAIATGFEKVGIPKKAAKTLAKIVAGWIL